MCQVSLLFRTPVPTSRGDLIDMFIEFGIEWQKQRSFSAIDYKNVSLFRIFLFVRTFKIMQ